jgi:hypothetical protein
VLARRIRNIGGVNARRTFFPRRFCAFGPPLDFGIAKARVTKRTWKITGYDGSREKVRVVARLVPATSIVFALCQEFGCRWDEPGDHSFGRHRNPPPTKRTPQLHAAASTIS